MPWISQGGSLAFNPDTGEQAYVVNNWNPGDVVPEQAVREVVSSPGTATAAPAPPNNAGPSNGAVVTSLSTALLGAGATLGTAAINATLAKQAGGGRSPIIVPTAQPQSSSPQSSSWTPWLVGGAILAGLGAIFLGRRGGSSGVRTNPRRRKKAKR